MIKLSKALVIVTFISMFWLPKSNFVSLTGLRPEDFSGFMRLLFLPVFYLNTYKKISQKFLLSLIIYFLYILCISLIRSFEYFPYIICLKMCLKMCTVCRVYLGCSISAIAQSFISTRACDMSYIPPQSLPPQFFSNKLLKTVAHLISFACSAHFL